MTLIRAWLFVVVVLVGFTQITFSKLSDNRLSREKYSVTAVLWIKIVGHVVSEENGQTRCHFCQLITEATVCMVSP